MVQESDTRRIKCSNARGRWGLNAIRSARCSQRAIKEASRHDDVSNPQVRRPSIDYYYMKVVQK